MGKPPFREAERLFHEVLALPAPQRAAFLDTACAGDAGLRATREELLRPRDGPTDRFPARPAADAAAQVRPAGPPPDGAAPGGRAAPRGAAAGHRRLRAAGGAG